MIELTHWRRPDTSVWPTIGRLFGLRDELDRLFEGASRGNGAPVRFWNPALDVYEDKDNLFVKAELAGFKKEDIEVSLENGVLTLSGERKDDEKFTEAQTRRSERFTGHFERSITLPSEVKADQVTAHYADGILTITLPKAEAAKPKQIEVKVS
ncbi:MAG TPA: Hsp20/alpha crystallin family protein [Verrucomicrobiae bacterium]|jgi:HSP20 family protein|nr:Hsp20/alpha crystallin family protein [Verrucomicrobiae bacterium]